MNYLEQARRVIEIEIEGLNGISRRLDEEFISAVEFLNETLSSKGKIVVVGVGKSGNIGHKIAATLNSTGATSVVMDSQNALHGDLGLLSDGDVVIALSYSGETQELLDLVPFLRRFEVRIIAVTGKRESTLGRLADLCLDTSVDREACPLNLAPTSSSTAMLVMGDALAMVLLESRGFTDADFAKFHPGGSLGRALLTRVADIMREGSALPTVVIGSNVFAALDSMNQARAGACVVVDETGRLKGIFTHGDFARRFREDPLLGEKPVEGYMTEDPVTVQSSALAVEVLQTLKTHRIDDLVVLSEEAMPIGLVDSQDLARLKIV